MLKTLLDKRAKGEQLTDEELVILKEYDDTVLEIKSELNTKIEEEKNKFINADTELQNKLKLIEELENSKKALEETINESKNIEDVKIKLREELEKKKQEELEKEKTRLKEMLDSLKQENENKLKEIKEEMEKQKLFNEKLQFKSFINEEILKRPYLEVQLKKLLNDIETSDLQQSKFLYNFLVESVNHDSEMEHYKKRLESGKNIFNMDINDNDKENIIKNKQDLEFEDFLKRNPNIR